jgi:hypothetical protein
MAKSLVSAVQTKLYTLPTLPKEFFPALSLKPVYGFDFAKNRARLQTIANQTRAEYQALASSSLKPLQDRRAALGDMLMAADALDSFYSYYLERGVTRADLLEVALSYAVKYGMEKGRIEGYSGF